MESTPEEAAEGLAIVRVLAAVLDRLVCANSPLARTEPGQITKFHALKAPGIGIQQYLERIHKYASCSSQCFIMALIYIDRLIQRNGFLLTELNVHRVIVTAVLLAAKFFDDAYYNNAYYAKVGGVLVSEMNGLEVDFLFRINFSLHVSPELFDQYRAELLSHSGVESISLQPPPSPQQFSMDQHMASVPQQLENHNQQTLQQQAAQTLQQQAAMCNPVIGGYHHMASGQHHHVPHQITPSPTRQANGAASTMDMVVAQAVKQQQDDEMMAAAVDQAVRANLPNMFAQEFSFLQRANSLPVQTKSLVTQVQMAQASQPLSAPAMMAMVPGVVNPNFPSLVDHAAAVASAALSNDPLVMMDNQFYQMPNLQQQQQQQQQHINHHHGNQQQQQRRVLDASDLIHHVHHHPSVASHHVPGFVSREASVSQRFASGQMVAGVSGGL